MRLRCGEIFNEASLHVYCWVWWWKKFENQPTFFCKLMGKSGVSWFLTHGVHY